MRDAKLQLRTGWHASRPGHRAARPFKWSEALDGANVARACENSSPTGSCSTPRVVFPLEAAAEREGHPDPFDGRLQRLRQAISTPRRRSTRLASLLRHQQGTRHRDRRLRRPDRLQAGLRRDPVLRRIVTLVEIGGKGFARWPEREAAAKWPVKKARRSKDHQGDARGQRQAAPRHLQLRLGRARVKASPALSFLTPTPGGRTVARGRQAPEPGQRPARSSNGTGGQVVLGRDAVPAGSVFLEGNAVADGLHGAQARVINFGDDVLRAVVDADRQGHRDLRWSSSASCRSSLLAERKLIGRFQHRYGPNRVGPFGLAAAARRHRQAALQAAVPPRTTSIAWLFIARAAPARSSPRSRALAIIPSRRRRHLRDEDRASTGVDPSIGILYLFAFGVDRLLRPDARRLVLGLEVLVPRLDALRRPADLLRGLAGPGAARRDHDGRLAVARRTSSRGSRATSGTSCPQFVGFLDLHGRRLRRDQPPPLRPRPRPTPSWSGAYITEYGGGRFGSFLLAEYLEHGRRLAASPRRCSSAAGWRPRPEAGSSRSVDAR